MSRRIYLVRHGTAEDRPDGQDSPERRLVDKGREQCAALARALERAGVRFDQVRTSPYLRAAETAECLLERLGLKLAAEREPRLEPSAALTAALAAVLEPQAERLLVVGHEPLLSELAVRLIGARGAHVALRKCGLVELGLLEGEPVRAELLALLRPGYL
ncbi:MAG TPA: phosphohistidine phosphatase SixA [Candidatus Polarisedimenticolaceae bacterium]|nr:phosphohistidine phosphatase SixA [Candidatus Polarisedimenticolaceae bacterium]